MKLSKLLFCSKFRSNLRQYHFFRTKKILLQGYKIFILWLFTDIPIFSFSDIELIQQYFPRKINPRQNRLDIIYLINFINFVTQIYF
jgi:hypothetical protein